MENVGQSKVRNKNYKFLFDRKRLIQNLVANKYPVIFDIGAHHGESIKYFKELFPKSIIHSFEPDPDSFDKLSCNKIDNVHCHNLAVSDSSGTKTFYRNKISHTNSLLKVNLASKDSIGITNAKKNNQKDFFLGFNSEFEVTTTTLDAFTQANLINMIDLLKIDVQGAECLVLSGGIISLKKTKILMLEISFFDYYENQTTFLNVETLLAPIGFKLYNISEVSNNPMNGRTDWAEVIYVNSTLLDLQ